MSDKDAIAGWKQDLNLILQVFNVSSASPASTIAKGFRSESRLSFRWVIT